MPQKESAQLREKAKLIHQNAIVLDSHIDIIVSNFTTEKNYTQDLLTCVNIPKMKKGEVDAAFLVVYTPQGKLNSEGYKNAYKYAIEKFDAIHRLTEDYAADRLMIAKTVKDIRNGVKTGKKAILIGVESAYPLGENISKVKEFYDRGARYMSVTHNGHNQVADSNTGEEDGKWLHNGLSAFGKEVIVEMNRLGMMIDLSHPSQESNKQAMALSKAPVIASHSSARALNDHSRNLYDEELLAIKETGGVVQAVAFPEYLNTEKADKHHKAAKKIVEDIAKCRGFEILEDEEIRALGFKKAIAYLEEYKKIEIAAESRIIEEVNPVSPPVDVADFIDHIDYMVDFIGIDHVGISSDFDGGGGVFGWKDASEAFNLTLELVARGYSEEDIKKLWGENLLRVMEEVQKVAKSRR